MGLFDLFKKRQKDEPIKKEISEDFDPFDINSVTDYLIGRIKEKRPNASPKEVANVINDILVPKKENLQHLTEDGELPFGWITANADFVEPTEKVYGDLLDTWIAEKNKGVMKEYSSLKALVVFMEDIKKECISRGECFERWSKIMVARPDDLERHRERLNYMELHLEEFLQCEKALKQLRTDLKKIIKSEPGIKQEHLYKRFSPELKNDIRNELYVMAQKGTIIREKSGRTYILYMKK